MILLLNLPQTLIMTHREISPDLTGQWSWPRKVEEICLEVRADVSKSPKKAVIGKRHPILLPLASEKGRAPLSAPTPVLTQLLPLPHCASPAHSLSPRSLYPAVLTLVGTQRPSTTLCPTSLGTPVEVTIQRFMSMPMEHLVFKPEYLTHKMLVSGSLFACFVRSEYMLGRNML